jgi:L-asparaginase / beta-aspartyl-peptidase
MKPAVIVHGGAEEIPGEKAEAMRQGCLRAAKAAWEKLEQGSSAVDAVEAAICVLEDDPNFNAGVGSTLTSAGEIEMDAGIMEGGALNAGAIAVIQNVRHPISIAKLVLSSEQVLLAGAGARAFALGQGAELCELKDLITTEQYDKWQEQTNVRHDTVGCVALDKEGHLAAGASTGGTGATPPGRVGDSASVGAGIYADDTLGACALTGDGEQIIRVVLAKTSIDFLNGHTPEEAAEKALEVLARVGGEAGIILIDKEGRIGWNHNAPNMSCAYRTSGMNDTKVFLAKNEERGMND